MPGLLERGFETEKKKQEQGPTNIPKYPRDVEQRIIPFKKKRKKGKSDLTVESSL